jgi:hypothetical protein
MQMQTLIKTSGYQILQNPLLVLIPQVSLLKIISQTQKRQNMERKAYKI